MENSEEYGPALPPGMIVTRTADESTSRPKIVGPSIPSSLRKSSDSDDLSDEGQLLVKMESDMSPEQSDTTVGPMPSEMAAEGENVARTVDDFEKRSKRMKEKLGVKIESSDNNPTKREEWMTELPPDMSKNFGLQSRQFSKGSGDMGDDMKDRSSWTDAPSVKKEKESKGKKRKREEEKALSARDKKLHHQVEEYNKDNRSESLLDIHSKNLKKKKNGSVPVAVACSTTTGGNPATPQPNTNVDSSSAALAQQHPQQQQQQPHLQQYYQLTDEIRDSLDLLSEQQQKQAEFYPTEFSGGEFNEAKPLADLLMTPNVVTYNQDGTVFTQAASTTYNSSQMIAQAYSHAQQMSTTAFTPQVASSSNSFSQSVQAPAGNITATVVNSGQGQEINAVQGQVQQPGHSIEVSGQTVQVNGHTIQAQTAGAANQINAQQVQNYAETAFATQISGDAAAAVAAVQQQQQQQQQQGQVVTFSLAGGQNMIIASPHTQQAGQNYVIASQGHQPGQNIVIAAQGQHTGVPTGNFIVKAEGDELGQNIVLTQQGLQQLGQNVVLTQDGLAAAGGENVILTTADGQRQQAIAGQRQIQTGQVQHAQPQQQVLTQANIPLQAAGGSIPQVSLVLPQVGSLFPQIQGATTPATTTSQISPQAFLQLCNKMDKMINMVTESHNTLFEMNKRVERIENHLFPPAGTTASVSPSVPVKVNKQVKPPRPPMPVSSTPSSSSAAAMSKANLKAALSSYLTISDYIATDELKRSDSNSDLFIPVGTVSTVHGQNVIEDPSPSDAQETATSTVQEMSTEQEMMPVVMENMATQGNEGAAQTQDINVPIVDSQSGLAVTVFEEGTENQKYELGPGSSKEPNARFSNTSNTPKTVILDPRFWDILVEDFQKNMSSDQIISAMASTRKPLVRSIGTSEISICSTVLKEAESACQGRRERLAKELVFRIFTLGEVYDRNVSGVFYINGKKMENKNKALDPAKMAAIHYLVMKYPPSVVDNPRLERLVWKNCVDRINDSLRRIYNWIHKIVDVNNIIDKLPTDSIMMP